jgi:hypothetical protein
MSDLKDSAHIRKLEGSNYQKWKFQILILLRSKELNQAIEEDLSHAKKATGDPNEEARNIDVRAQFFISATCNDKCLDELITCTSAYQMWKKLANNHANNAKVNKHLLWQRFFQYTFDNAESITANISELEILAAQLKDMGETVTDASLVTKLIISLPQGYDSLQAAWDNLPENDQTLANLTARLLKAESLRSDREASTSFYVKSRNHKQQRSNSTTNSATAGTVKRCDNHPLATSHWTSESKSRTRQSAPIRTASAPKDDKNANLSSSAFFTDTSISTNAEHWYADTGASDNMTGHKEWFRTLTAIPRGRWSV